MTRQVIQTPDAPAAIGPYSQAIRAGGTVYLSGQIGLDPKTGQLVEGVEAQAHQVLANLRAVASAAGGSLDDIVKVTLLLADLGDFTRVNEIMAAAFKPPYPARATYQVAGLPKGARIEVEGVMVLRARRCGIGADRMARDVRPDQGPVATARRGSPRSNGETAKASPSKPRAKPGDALAQKLARLGVSRDEDLVLHLPLRYEDRTRLTPLADLRAGDTAQAEGTVVRTDVQYRPRRQLVCLLEDERDGHRARLVLRFFSFYPNQQKALAHGQPRARVRRGARRPFRARDRASGISRSSATTCRFPTA